MNLPNGKNNASMSLPSDCPSTNLEQAPAAILVLSVVSSRLHGACRLLVVVSTLSGVYQYIRHAISWYNSQGSHVSTGQKILALKATADLTLPKSYKVLESHHCFHAQK